MGSKAGVDVRRREQTVVSAGNRLLTVLCCTVFQKTACGHEQSSSDGRVKRQTGRGISHVVSGTHTPHTVPQNCQIITA